MAAPVQNRAKAASFALLAVSLASMQDAIVKGVSTELPAYETVIFRTLVSFPLLFGWLLQSGAIGQMFAAHMGALFLRSLILCSAYFAFVLSIAAMPIATSVSIYFSMPFFVAGFSGYSLGERVPMHRWIAIIAGFVGVLITVRPGIDSFEPGVLLALYSAFGYAWGQMMGRKLSHRVEPVVIANWQNLIYFAAAVVIGIVVHFTGVAGGDDKIMAFLTRPWSWPTHTQMGLLGLMGVLSAAASVLFINAYRYAEANFVAPFEYSAIIWATLYGILFFMDFPDKWNLAGTALVIAAGLYMLQMDRRKSAPVIP